MPASRSTRRWCETVGWPTSQQDVKSQAHVSLLAGELTHDGKTGRVGQGRQEPDVGVQAGGSGSRHASTDIAKLRY